MQEKKAYSADRIFTGDEWLTDHVILTSDGKIIAVTDASRIEKNIPVEHFAGCFLAPAFLDLQIYGAYGRLLSVYPVAGSLFKLNEYCRQGGAGYCLPTVATNTTDVFYKCIDAIRDYWEQGGDGIGGLHIEGPWINVARRGAHIESLIHAPSIEEVNALLEYGKGVIRMITLAPEICTEEIIDLLIGAGIVVSAGHSNASYEEAIKSFDKGIRTITHLYNAMSPLQHRQPGLVGAAMDHGSVMASIIPDGHHSDYAAVRIAKKIMKERLFVITDAVTKTEEGYYPHEEAGDKYIASGILSGSALTMNKAMKNLVNYCGIETGEALRMCGLYPARVMKLDRERGRIQAGYHSDIAVINENLELKKLIS